jgi:hypothetical protein
MLFFLEIIVSFMMMWQMQVPVIFKIMIHLSSNLLELIWS